MLFPTLKTNKKGSGKYRTSHILEIEDVNSVFLHVCNQ